MAKIDFTQELKDVDGNVLGTRQQCVVVDQSGNFLKDNSENFVTKTIETKNPMLLKGVCVDCLLANTPQGEQVSGEDKAKRYKLAMRIHDCKGSIDLDSEDVSLIKKLVGEFYGPLIVGQAHMMLEGKSKK